MVPPGSYPLAVKVISFPISVVVLIPYTVGFILFQASIPVQVKLLSYPIRSIALTLMSPVSGSFCPESMMVHPVRILVYAEVSTHGRFIVRKHPESPMLFVQCPVIISWFPSSPVYPSIPFPVSNNLSLFIHS